MTLSDTDLETRLRRDLRARADDVPPAPRDLAELTRQRHRSLRRRDYGIAAAALTAVLVFVGVPVVASTLATAPPRGQVAAPSGRTFTPSPPTGLYALPPRGSLADDETWLAAVAALDWKRAEPGADVADMPEPPDPPVDTRRIAFAGDVPSGRVALVLGMDGGVLAHAWFVGPRGAGPGEMVPATYPSTSGPYDSLSLLDAPSPSAATVTLVVVAQPGDTVSRGTQPYVDSAGNEHADRVPVAVEDGIGIAAIPAPWPWSTMFHAVQVDRRSGPGGGQVQDSDRLGGDREVLPLDPGIAVDDPRELGDRIQRPNAEFIAGRRAAGYGLTAAQARPTLLAAGPLGPRTGMFGELYGMTHPSGATTTWLTVYPTGSDARGQIFDFPPAPAGTALLDRVIAVRAMAGLVVSAPAGVEAQALDASGAVRTTIQLDRGAGTGPLDDPAASVTVRIVDGRGAVLAEVPVIGVGG